MAIAFFDLDRTLIAKNSASLWVKSELRDGEISTWQAVRAGTWLLRYRLGFANMEHAVRKAITGLEGKEEAPVKARAFAFYDREIHQLYRPGAHAVLRKHRKSGDQLVLLTSSSAYMSEKVCAALELDAVLCTRFEVDEEGRYTGRPVEPLCYGQGKVAHAQAYADGHGVNLQDCAFYTDSTADLPLMEVVGLPVAVNPDPLLLKTARSRGWEVVDWGEA